MIDRGPFSVRPDADRYEVEEKVAEGGMGVIYRVLDRRLGRTVAMKVCSRRPSFASRGVAGSDSAGARFLEEAHVTARLDHPGIVPVHELGVSSEDLAYFTMPFVNGSSLGAVFALARQGLEGWNLSRAAAALIKVCQAVAYAHSKGIIHRDLKPANVMVGSFGQVYVLDWGLAKVVANESGGASVTEDGLVLGTPAYMPPEQASGKWSAVVERSDVYALGAMLYELLTGQPPYVPAGSSLDPQAVLARVVEGPPRRVAVLEPKAPRELAAICEKAMAREPGERYAGALELAEDLQAFLDHRVISAYRTGILAELRAWCYRRRALLAAAGAVALVSTIVLFALNWHVRDRDAEHLIQGARADIERHNVLKTEISQLQRAWLDAGMAQSPYAPAWHREEEIRIHRSLESARSELDSRFNESVRQLLNALRIAPPSEARRIAATELKDLYLSRYRAIVGGDSFKLSAQYYRGQLEALDPAAAGASLDPPGRISISSDPDGAEVYCFRYVECDDTRLEPRPFDVAAREAIGEPFLRVESILDAPKHQGIFAVGDRLVEVRGRTVQSRADLAHALEGLSIDEKIEVQVERLGSRLRLEWRPFPAGARTGLKPGSLVAIPEQLGLSFEGYPLEFVDRCRLGVTGAGKPLTAELPTGSYLFLLRKQGYSDVRFPVVIPWRDRVETVRLVEAGQVPPGFIYVPAGPFSHGGDPYAFQSLERGEAELRGFFIARLEVTIAEYLEYLNDPEVLARTRDDGTAEPEAKDVQAELAALGSEKLFIVPAQSKGALFFQKRGASTWSIAEEEESSGRLKPTSPAISICQLAAREYAHWRSRKSGKWTYRLPDDLEWEKSARGVDRRTHVWGEYLIWSFCWSAKGTRAQRIPGAVGFFSTDESVYGIRDLAGSVDEHTSSKISSRDATHRGGNWSVSDTQNLRIATRNGRLTTGRGTETGFRLVAEMGN